MKRNTALLLVGLIILAVLGGGGAYYAYRKIQQRKNFEFRYEGKFPVGAQFDVEAFKTMILADENVEDVVEGNDLVAFWELDGPEAAKQRVKSKFSASVANSEVKVRYQDKDKAMAKKILQGLLQGYQNRLKASGGGVPQG
ncbi:hypothetical protein HW115_14015 [Verrucomicrobiaceae bacterium N1E253]|uniref:Uncharacterized protein n=1 Tax=Oceaniferula marina TaxID=2748318 RepID=A0A851GNM9_9BACT|nr:hypothetical protein [Oceaniferula marina]NWK56735.1 hypothetical protein [Oceaniferula marina]